MLRHAIVVVAIAGCGEKPVPPAASGSDLGSGSGSAITCIADQVDPHDRVWVRDPTCAADDVKCKANCETQNDSSACMSRALILEKDPAQREEANLMFIRACALGTIAGCTNYAGFLWANNKNNAASECAYLLFQKTCAVKDPFGCGMLGRMTIDNAPNADAAALGKRALEGACGELGGFPCRVLAMELETKKLGDYDPSLITSLLGQACSAGDQAACGTHATATETFK